MTVPYVVVYLLQCLKAVLWIGVRWYFVVVLICKVSMTPDENTFWILSFLAIQMSCLLKRLSRSFAHFLIELCYCGVLKSLLYNLDKNALSDVFLAVIYLYPWFAFIFFPHSLSHNRRREMNIFIHQLNPQNVHQEGGSNVNRELITGIGLLIITYVPL